jgi:hypothetical protein
MQEEAAEKMDELLKPIEIGAELKKLGEPRKGFFVGSRGNTIGNG